MLRTHRSLPFALDISFNNPVYTRLALLSLSLAPLGHNARSLRSGLNTHSLRSQTSRFAREALAPLGCTTLSHVVSCVVLCDCWVVLCFVYTYTGRKSYSIYSPLAIKVRGPTLQVEFPVEMEHTKTCVSTEALNTFHTSLLYPTSRITEHWVSQESTRHGMSSLVLEESFKSKLETLYG